MFPAETDLGSRIMKIRGDRWSVALSVEAPVLTLTSIVPLTSVSNAYFKTRSISGRLWLP